MTDKPVEETQNSGSDTNMRHKICVTHFSCDCLQAEITHLRSELQAHRSTPLGSKINELIIERGDLREQVRVMRSALEYIRDARGKKCLEEGCTCLSDTAAIALQNKGGVEMDGDDGIECMEWMILKAREAYSDPVVKGAVDG